MSLLDRPGRIDAMELAGRGRASIGRLQNEDVVRSLFPGLPVVRRPTGGRAVLHGQDLTISLALRLEWLPPECRSVPASYRLLMEPVKAALEAVDRKVCYG